MPQGFVMASHDSVRQIAAVGLALATLAGVAHAAERQPFDTVAPPTRPMRDLVTALGDADWATRNAATTELSSAPHATIDALISAVAEKNLEPEQHLRLTNLAWERFSRTPRAALGVSFQNNFVGGMESGAVISGTIEGFDSQRVLKPGDTIYSMSEVRIHSMDDGKRVIQSHEPGERVTLRLFREGQPVIVRVTLGSMVELNSKDRDRGVRPAEPAVVRDAFRLRLQRSLGTKVQRQLLDLTEFWETLIEPFVDSNAPDHASPDQDLEPPAILVAGGRQGEVGEGNFDPFGRGTDHVQGRIAALLRQIQIIDTQIQVLQQQAADPNIGAERRVKALRQLESLHERRAQLKLEIHSLQAGRRLQQP
jgi:PDZ domain